jgi:hypothetical protein
MTTEPVRSRTGDAGVFLPADGLSLLGESPGSGYGRQFRVGRSDGQVVQLPLLLYLVTAAVAEGSVDGGWSAEQVGARVQAASGQALTADNVHYLIAGKLAPLGLIVAAGPARPDGSPGPVARLLSWPAGRRLERLLRQWRGWHWALALGGTVLLVSVVTAGPLMAGTGSRETGGTRPAPVPGSASASGSRSAPAPAPASVAAASRVQAAAWVVQQVSPDVTVSCDPGMCRQLRRDGFPAARLKSLPDRARGPLPPGVVVATPAVQSQLGPRLAAVDAPQVIASFGSGVARVAIRTTAPHGAAAFKAQLAAEMTALASVGGQLAGNRNIQASPSARAQLRAGRVDARLLAILALLSAQRPVRLVSFAGAPGADPGAPLRAAEISVGSPASRSAVLSLLAAQQGPYRPSVAGGGSSVITLRFDAPASLNISQP